MTDLPRISISDEMHGSYIDYAMSVIVARALPDARDGLKPVHRRILYAMYEMGIRPGTPFKKSARIVGEVLGKFHPHSDDAVYDAMSRMAQEFSLRYELVEGQGNFGSIDGDRPAAMRYTEARLSAISSELLSDINKETVDFGENYDGSQEEPLVLPARLPNLLLNGSSGIAVGMSTNIPPHNLREICEALLHLIDHYEQRDTITVADLLQFIKGPDFPTGAKILVSDALREAYSKGRGRIVIRSSAEFAEAPGDRIRIVFRDIPYQVSKAAIIERIVELVRNGQISGISDLRDESDRDGLRLVVDLNTRAQPTKVLNRLYKFTQLQTTFSMQLLALDGGVPQLINLKNCLLIHLRHRLEVIRRRSEFELRELRARAHILAGLLLILQDIDKAIVIIRNAADVEEAKQQLQAQFSFVEKNQMAGEEAKLTPLSEKQADAVLAMRLRRLVALEWQKLTDEHTEVLARIDQLQAVLSNEHLMLAIIREDIQELIEKYGDERRTELLYGESDEFDEADLVRQEPVGLFLTSMGYIKRVPLREFRAQLRGGRGVIGVSTREDDFPAQSRSAMNLDTVLFFTNQGRVYAERAFRIPEKGRTSRGIPLRALLPLRNDEHVTAMLPYKQNDDHGYFVMATRSGYIKRVAKSAFSNIRASGIIAISLEANDELEWVRISSGNQEIILASTNYRSVRFSENEVSVLGRIARGVNAMRLSDTGELAGMDVITTDSEYVLIVTDLGYGKITEVSEYPSRSRYIKGVLTFKQNEKRGEIIALRVIKATDEILLMSCDGTILRTHIQHMNATGRVTQGIRLMSLSEGDRVVSVAVLPTHELEPKPNSVNGAQAITQA